MADWTNQFQAATTLLLFLGKVIDVAVSVRSIPFFLIQISILSSPPSVLSIWAENWILYTPAFSVLMYVLKGLILPLSETPFVIAVSLNDIELGVFATGFVCIVVS